LGGGGGYHTLLKTISRGSAHLQNVATGSKSGMVWQYRPPGGAISQMFTPNIQRFRQGNGPCADDRDPIVISFWGWLLSFSRFFGHLYIRVLSSRGGRSKNSCLDVSRLSAPALSCVSSCVSVAILSSSDSSEMLGRHALY
jgi:hypothetical protein